MKIKIKKFYIVNILLCFFLLLCILCKANLAQPQSNTVTSNEVTNLQEKLQQQLQDTSKLFYSDVQNLSNIEIAFSSAEEVLKTYRSINDQTGEEYALSLICSIVNSEKAGKTSISKKKSVEYCASYFENQIEAILDNSIDIDSNKSKRMHNVEVYRNLSKLYKFAGDYEVAIAFLDKASTESKVFDTPNDYTGEYADIYFEAKNYKKAVQYYRKLIDKETIQRLDSYKKQSLKSEYSALSYGFFPDSPSKTITSERINIELIMIHERSHLGYSLLKLGRINDAEQELLHALDNLETLIEAEEGFLKSKRFNPIPVSGTRLIDENRIIYESLQKLYIDKGDFPKALETSERGRALGLFVATTVSENPTNFLQVEQTNLEELKNIAQKNKITFVEYSIIDNQYIYIYIIDSEGDFYFKPINIKSLSSSVGEKTYSAVRKNFYTLLLIPVFWFVVSKRNKFLLICSLLLILQGCSIPLLHSQQENTCTITNSSITLTSYIGEAFKTVRGEDLSQTNNSFNELANIDDCLFHQYNLLVKPIEKLLHKRKDSHIVFIPDKDIFKVPFSALKLPSGDYLIDKYSFSILSSIKFFSTLSESASQRPEANIPAVVVGNPKLPENLERLGELPHSETEANTVAQILESNSLTGTEATETAVLAQLSEANIIHIAAHGVLDYQFENVSQNTNVLDIEYAYFERMAKELRKGVDIIALSSSSQDDGLLNEIELYNKSYKANLVVLSACDTGLGEITSNGVIGLATPFTANGVPTVIASLWPVSDAATSELMTKFYSNLTQNMGISDSFRNAIAELKEKYPNPRIWAPFFIVGMPNPPQKFLASETNIISKNELSVEKLRNAVYKLPDVFDKAVKLENGQYYEKYFVQNLGDSRSQLSVVLGDTFAFGDLDNDGDKDAVAILAYNTGGSGTYFRLAIILNEGGLPVHIYSDSIGDRTAISNISILPNSKVELTGILWPRDVFTDIYDYSAIF
ncbi:CHAT domain-containing tetratricopeptide repeat protein [Sphaerothrix gracilis]|uniref:CHAT domain-containing protein n=1 Tax=Sphaerothrix gracilis TaxID=3151835 RepID=UPI0031FD63E2